MKDLKLKYYTSAEDSIEGWEKYSFPIGNGYAGASIFGGAEKERVQITTNVFANTFENGGVSDFAEIYINFGAKNYADYVRRLDVLRGVASSEFKFDNVSVKREAFYNYPDNVLVYKISTDKAIDFSVNLVIPYLGARPVEQGGRTGTFVPTFITIPAVGTAATFLIFAGVLAAISIVYFAFARKRMIKGIVAAVVIVGLCFTLPTYSFAFWESDITLEDESIYNYLQVKDSDTRTILSTNVLFGVQSIQRKDTELTGMYYDYALAAPCMAGMNGSDNDSRSVMILGMGSGTYASYCVRYYPGVSVQGAEIDRKIADIATEYFGLPDSVEVAVEDGRAYLTASQEQFDVIMVDAYQDITIPFQLSSVEFFTQVQRHLKPGGVMVVNLNMTSQQEGSINQYLCDTMASVFAHTYWVNVPSNTNTVVFCTDADGLRQTFDANRALLQNASYAAMMEKVAQNLQDYTGGDHILTDDKAPVELLGMRVLDELIEGELNYYKEQFSMQEIINMVT